MHSRLEWIEDWGVVARQARYRVGEMARLTGVSRQALHAYFLSRQGQTPRAWLQDQMLQQAAERRQAGEAVKSVADKLGYANSANFCRAQRQHPRRSA